MANKAKKDNKNIIIGVCAAIIVIVIVVVAIVIGAANSKPTLNDAYFVSDGTKYVLTLDSDDPEDETAPIKSHMVYFYSGDEITGAKTYYEFKDVAAAKTAYELIKESLVDASTASIDGKYVIVAADESEYKDISASEVKQQIDLMETFKNINVDDDTEEE